MSDSKNKIIAEGKEETYCRTLSLMGIMGGGAEGVCDVKDGKIIRVRPLHYDWRYRKEDLNPWKIERDGAVLEPNMKSLPPPFNLAYKKRAYSPNRIKYPLKRVDWIPMVREILKTGGKVSTGESPGMRLPISSPVR